MNPNRVAASYEKLEIISKPIETDLLCIPGYSYDQKLLAVPDILADVLYVTKRILYWLYC